nr:MAG TPA: hypothetical protein [Caudoviricetes sp.]
MSILNKPIIPTEQLITVELMKALETFCMYEEELDILLKNMDIRGHQLYINVTEDFKYREFYLQWNMTRFIRLNIDDIYFRNNNFDKPVRIRTHKNHVKEYGLSYVEFNEGLVVRSNNRIISL